MLRGFMGSSINNFFEKSDQICLYRQSLLHTLPVCVHFSSTVKLNSTSPPNKRVWIFNYPCLLTYCIKYHSTAHRSITTEGADANYDPGLTTRTPPFKGCHWLVTAHLWAVSVSLTRTQSKVCGCVGSLSPRDRPKGHFIKTDHWNKELAIRDEN